MSTEAGAEGAEVEAETEVIVRCIFAINDQIKRGSILLSIVLK
jgi:hypothetical protein